MAELRINSIWDHEESPMQSWQRLNLSTELQPLSYSQLRSTTLRTKTRFAHCVALCSTQHCNVFKKFLDFHNSEVTSKWLRRVKLTSPWPTPSAWNSAKHWPPRARLSTSPWTWAPTSPSPWTPGARRWHLNLCWERKEAPQHRGEMPSAEWNSSTKRGKPLLPLWTP